MAFSKLLTIAWRDLWRNRRRSLFTLIAVALGLALLMLLNGFIAGVMEDSLQNSIRLETGHLQLRSASYAEETVSLEWKNLIDDVDALIGQAKGLGEVKAATPVLWATSVLNTVEDSIGLRIYGIEPDSAFYEPIRQAMVAGDFVAAGDRNGILLGKHLAEEMKVAVGDRVVLTIINADGSPDEAQFTVRGLFSTGILSYDQGAALMSLVRAQSFTGTAGHVSAIVLLLSDQNNADKVAAELATPQIRALTWQKLNEIFLQAMETGLSFYVILDFIVMLVVAVVIANTLLMAVFERTREMGILAALGMKPRQILLMFLLEAALLGVVGIILGYGLGSAGVGYLAKYGIDFGEGAAAAAQNIPLATRLYARYVPDTFIGLSFGTLVVILLASLYPAWFAARLEPVKALHAV
ncbi:MAG: FtsX-like permease family protein [Caldilineaceae bacterium]